MVGQEAVSCKRKSNDYDVFLIVTKYVGISFIGIISHSAKGSDGSLPSVGGLLLFIGKGVKMDMITINLPLEIGIGGFGALKFSFAGKWPRCTDWKPWWEQGVLPEPEYSEEEYFH